MGETKPKYKNWKCPQGHVYQSPIPVTEVRCGICAKNVDTAKSAMMTPDLGPSA